MPKSAPGFCQQPATVSTLTVPAGLEKQEVDLDSVGCNFLAEKQLFMTVDCLVMKTGDEFGLFTSFLPERRALLVFDER